MTHARLLARPAARRRRSRSRWGGALAVLLAGALALPSAGCASTPEAGDDGESPVAEAPLQDLPASGLAKDLGLVLVRGEDRVTLAPADASGSLARIVLFPGTSIATVMGDRMDLTQALRTVGDEVWIAAADVGALRARWEILDASGRATTDTPAPASTSRAPLPDAPTPGAHSAPSARAPRTGFGDNAPTAAETSAWSVPLRRRWDYIVVHHSASASGSAAAIHRWHLDRGYDGLGYDFVIGNGTGSRDGEIEVGYRWRQQLVGAHTRTSSDTNFMNEHGIGICLVGDFTKTHPSAAQMRALDRLCTFLAQYCRISPSHLRLHGELKSTACPGKYFPRDFAIRLPGGDRTAGAQSR